MCRSRLLLIPFLGLIPALFAIASPEAPPKSDYNPPIAKASDDAQKAIPRFQFDKSLKVEVWAAEPMLANPVAFAFDEKGRCFVAETFRLHHGVTDDRGHMNWLADDLASRSTADRVAIYKKDAGPKFHRQYETARERIRLLEDTTGSGRADKATVFRDDFGRAEDGLGAGILARKGDVYYTCIPDLWLLKDTKGTGTADTKKSLATGFGVHTSFIGHDLHGLRIGPDGRLYFSLGDRGMNVRTREGKHLLIPDTGAVLRCELDGSNLEVFATGLRNPQELAFDDYGNLFTVDNNSDSGDQARFLHLVEGGDYGWRIGYQYETRMHDSSVKQGNRGPWNYEQLWKPDTQAAYLLPAIKNYSNGPSGFTAYPGVGLSDRYKGHFFLANFSGSPPNSGIYSFGIKPKGASFEMTDDHKFVWNILATDCEFGPDGAFYISDWVNGWNLPGMGRIYKVTDPQGVRDPAVAEAQKLIAESFDGKSVDELLKLLGHPHRGVRMEAQVALAAKGKDAIPSLMNLARDPKVERLARIHALWALGMITRKWNAGRKVDHDLTQASADCEMFLKDPDPEIRAQAARLVSDPMLPVAREKPLQELLLDGEPRVRLFAALALARISRPWPKGYLDGLPPAQANATLQHKRYLRNSLLNMVWKNGGADPYLRFAGACALAAGVPTQILLEMKDDKSPEVRLALAVALRRQKAPEVGEFLGDSDPKVVAEAARAINDEVITAALAKLADLLSRPQLSPVVAYRALNVHFLLGKAENARALAEYASRADVPETLRALAIRMLGDWAKPPRRDYITGLTQDRPPRPREEAVNVLVPPSVLGQLARGPKAVRAEFVSAARKLDLKEAAPVLADLVADDKGEPEVRVEALHTLAALKDNRLA
ncbi:MAG: PQQ-dependent sugar dehydrogenase, partial [Zavarzinella sp.]|nr:PQQ-dependent sugar dehydrogenase [Zavarzinella sp.]